MGILFVLIAVAAWGLGDFLIQKSARKIGDWEALFVITFFGTVVLLPFVYDSLSTLSASDLLVLGGTSFVIFVAALLDFDALRVGKISVIEPILALEVPVTVALATFILGEKMTVLQIGLIISLLVGIYLVSNKHLTGIHARTLERGVLVAIIATLGMGLANFLYGFGARETTPLIINWFTSTFMAAATLAFLVYTKQTWKLWHNFQKNKGLILAVSVSDNIAWVAYSASVLYLPIGIATGLTESYIVLAALLGLTFGGEKLVRHQKFGLVIAVITAIVLAFTVS